MDWEKEFIEFASSLSSLFENAVGGERWRNTREGDFFFQDYGQARHYYRISGRETSWAFVAQTLQVDSAGTPSHYYESYFRIVWKDWTPAEPDKITAEWNQYVQARR
jgi:hypothetical protein